MKTIVSAIILLLTSPFGFSQTDSTFRKIAFDLHFPEGPAWDGNENLYVSSCHGGYISRINGSDVVRYLDSTDNPNLKQTNGLTVYKDGNIFACDYGIGAILKISPNGKTEIFIDGYESKKFNRPNDLAFDKQGNLYFTDPKSYGKDKLDGRIFSVEMTSKQITLLDDGLAFPNGIAFSPDGKKLFVCESAMNRILVYDVRKEGSLHNKTVFADIPGGDPDGLALDVEGNVYAAHFGGGAIYIFSPSGKLNQKIITPGKNPSNIEFGEKDMKTLFLTEDETNSVYSMRVEIPGLKLFSSP